MKIRTLTCVILVYGLILFSSRSVFAQDGLIVDTNGNIGVGTSSPSTNLHVVGAAGTLPSVVTGTTAIFQRNGASQNVAYISVISGNEGQAGILLGDSDTIQEGRILKDMSSNDLTFYHRTTALMTLQSAGNVGIKTNNQFGGGQGVLSIANAALNPTSYPVDAALFYVIGGEMYVRDGNGNYTQISPHPAEEIEALAEPSDPYPHFEKSANHFIGKEIVIDKGKAFRLLQTLFPDEKFIWYRDVTKIDIAGERREAWKKDWIIKNARTVEITKDQAFTLVDIELEDKAQIAGEKVSYALEGRDVVEVRQPVYAKRIEQKWVLKEGVTFNSDTGRFFMQVLPTDAEAEAAAQQQYDQKLAKWVKDRM